MIQNAMFPVGRLSSASEQAEVQDAPPAYEGSEEAALLAVLPHACFVLDPDWRFTYVNPAAEKLFGQLSGQVRDSLLGRNIWEECPELADSTFSKQCHEALTGQKAAEVETYYPTLDRWFAIDVCPRGNRLCVFLQDVSERTRLERELRRRGEELTAADRGKDAFLLQLAHQVRNALASVRNALHLVGSHHLGRDDRQVCAMADEEVLGLSRLMDDLLRVSEINLALPNKERVNLSALVGQSLQEMLTSPGAGGRNFSVQVPPEPLWLDADPGHLEQVLRHLLDNAVKFTSLGGNIRLTAERAGAAIVLRVQDNGIGLTTEGLPHIFNLFMRPDNNSNSFQGGLRVGLTLVRRLVELHGGSIEALSEGPNRGSQFVVRLPAPEASRKPAGALQTSGAGGRPLRVLVVDDNADGAWSLSLLLENWGCEVQIAYDGLKALEMARAWPPDVALLDLKMPRMDGYEVADWLRRNEQGSPLTVVAMTGSDQTEDRERARDVGFDYFMVKPVDPDDLKGLLERF
jgi:PAS domain S-box-containing protein